MTANSTVGAALSCPWLDTANGAGTTHWAVKWAFEGDAVSSGFQTAYKVFATYYIECTGVQ